MTVPIVGSKPDGPPIQVAMALARRTATGSAARIGTTLCGRGGPGMSGVALIEQGETTGPGLP